MGYIFAAVIFLTIAMFGWFGVRGNNKATYTLRNIPKKSVRDLVNSATSGGNTLGKAEGQITCENPITSELSQQQCAYYKMEVIEHYRETTKDSDNRTTTSTETRTVASNERYADIYLEDSGSRIKVNLEGAQFEPEKVLDKYEPMQSSTGVEISFGGFSLALGSAGNVEGHQYLEYIVPVDKEVLIAGAVEKDGEAYFTSPTDRRYAYIMGYEKEAVWLKKPGV